MPSLSILLCAALVPLVSGQNFGGDTENGLDGACKDITVIFARGTFETGNVGTITGPPFFEALASAVGASSLAVQGVDYPADVAGFIAGGDAQGSQTMADLVTQAISQCPDSQVVMSGYSQGGQLVHNAAKLLPSDITASVAAAVIFGDPDNGQSVQGVSASKTDIICHSDDDICKGGYSILPAHLDYSQDAGAAADFVASATGH